MKRLGILTLTCCMLVAPGLARPGRPSAGTRTTESPRSGSTTFQRPTVSANQQQNILKLQGDLQALKAGSQVTPAQKQKLADDLMVLAQGTTKPSQASVNELANSLTAATADSHITPKEQANLMQDVAAVMNSANIPQSEVEAVIADAQAILVSSGVSSQEVQMVVADLQAIANEVKATH